MNITIQGVGIMKHQKFTMNLNLSYFLQKFHQVHNFLLYFSNDHKLTILIQLFFSTNVSFLKSMRTILIKL